MNVSLERPRDWSLHRKGPIDAARHEEKVREAIRGNMGDLIREKAIYETDGQTTIRLPIRELELPHFRFDPNKRNYTGQGTGGSKVGDVIGSDDEKGQKGPEENLPSGNTHEIVDFSLFEGVVLEGLELPNLTPKARKELPSEYIRFDDIRKKGIMSNLDKRRTVLENVKRNALARRPGFKGLEDKDLRFRTWESGIKREFGAVVIFMRDISGSMGSFERDISRAFCFWTLRFLNSKYPDVHKVFITHHIRAEETDAVKFFTIGSDGGTQVSSAYQLALGIIEERYSPDQWNIYPFHISDGGNNSSSDDEITVGLAEKLGNYSNRLGYEEIAQGKPDHKSRLMVALSALATDRYVRSTIAAWDDVRPALGDYFCVAA